MKTIKKTYPAEVILITGHDSAESREQGMTSGAADYLPKPFDMGVLIRRMRKAACRF